MVTSARRRVPAAMVIGLAVVISVLCLGSATATAGAPAVQAEAFVLESSLDGGTLAARGADDPRAIASITKLMTALVAREHVALDEIVVVPRAAASVGESTIALRAGQRVTVRDLLIGTLVPSANDAATALALHAARGSLPRFVGWMNAKARALGLAETSFRNPHGLDQVGHRSSARDVARLLRAALADPAIRRYARAATATLSNGATVESTDNLIGRFPGFVGGKTGHTSAAGWSQVAAVRRHGVTITASVLGEATEWQRDVDLAALLRFGLDSFGESLVVDPRRIYAHVDVGWGLEPVAVVARARVVKPVPTGRPLVERVVVPAVVPLPLHAGQRLGSLVVSDGQRVVVRVPLVAAATVPSPTRAAQARYLARRTVHHLVGWFPG
jgi:D-alanyl-D-alanine carboxypeptidase (penicillin-binding protein 5/6)